MKKILLSLAASLVLLTNTALADSISAETTQLPAGSLITPAAVEIDYIPMTRAVTYSTLPIEEYVYNSILNYSTYISVSEYNMTCEEFDNWYIDFIYKNGDLPLNPSGYSYSANNGMITAFAPIYLYETADEHSSKIDAMNTLIDSICTYANTGSNDTEKVLLAHEKIAENYYFDDNPTVNDDGSKSYAIISHTAYGFLENGYGVCQGYSVLMGEVLDRLNIENAYCASDILAHVWNYIKLDGMWYHTDVTWDDSMSNQAYVSHRYFLASDDKIYQSHTSGDWICYGLDTLPTCDSTKYESGYVFNGFHQFIIRKEDDVLKFNAAGYEFQVTNIKSHGVFVSQPLTSGTKTTIAIMFCQSYSNPMQFFGATFTGGRFGGTRVTNVNGVTLTNTIPITAYNVGVTEGKYMLLDSTNFNPVAETVIIN